MFKKQVSKGIVHAIKPVNFRLFRQILKELLKKLTFDEKYIHN